MIDRRSVLRVVLRVVATVTAVVAAIIVIGILFVVLEGNRDNSLVSAATDAAEFLAGPFDELFTPGSRKLGVAVSWGIAALVYVVLGRIVAGLVDRSST